MPDVFYFGFCECFGGAPDKWEKLMSFGLFTVVIELRYPDRTDGLLCFREDAFATFKAFLDFHKRAQYFFLTGTAVYFPLQSTVTCLSPTTAK